VGLGCLGAMSGTVSFLPKASPGHPRRRAPEGYDCVSGEDLRLGRGRGKAEDTYRVGGNSPGTLRSPWVRGGGIGSGRKMARVSAKGWPFSEKNSCSGGGEGVG
jgi:hypothetical protein